MAEGKKIGEGMVKEMAQKGLEELRNAVSLQPQSYEQLIAEKAAQAVPTQQREGMTR
jgi:hypothetical protein